MLYVKPIEPMPAAPEVFYGDGTSMRRVFGNVVLAVGGVPVRTSARQPLRRVGADYVVEHEDGSATIYSGAEGYREALRDGLLKRAWGNDPRRPISLPGADYCGQPAIPAVAPGVVRGSGAGEGGAAAAAPARGPFS
jgi:hypothetical protein